MASKPKDHYTFGQFVVDLALNAAMGAAAALGAGGGLLGFSYIYDLVRNRSR